MQDCNGEWGGDNHPSIGSDIIIACNYNVNATEDDAPCYKIFVDLEDYSYEHQKVVVNTDASVAIYSWYLGEDLLRKGPEANEMIPVENGKNFVVITDHQECSVTKYFSVAGLYSLKISTHTGLVTIPWIKKD